VTRCRHHFARASVGSAGREQRLDRGSEEAEDGATLVRERGVEGWYPRIDDKDNTIETASVGDAVRQAIVKADKVVQRLHGCGRAVAMHDASSIDLDGNMDAGSKWG
jgi:hypothetical protein